MNRTANAKMLRPNPHDKRWGATPSPTKQLHVIGVGSRENHDRAKSQPQEAQSGGQKGKADLIRTAFSSWFLALGHGSKQAYRVSKRFAKSFRDNILIWQYPDWILFSMAIYFGFAVWSWFLG